MINERKLQNLIQFLKKYNINAYTFQNYRNVLIKSHEWYRGNVNGFHLYNQIVGRTNRQYERKTYNLAKKLCEDFASFLWNEKSGVTFNDPTINERLQDTLTANNFELMFTDFIEKVTAYGGGAIVVSVRNGEPIIDFINAADLLITEQKNNNVYGLVVANTFTIDKAVYYHLTEHKHKGTEYTIKHMLIKTEGDSAGIKSYDFGLLFSEEEINEMVYDPEAHTLTQTIETAIPFFQYFKTNIANNIDNNSPYGLSRLANLFDDLEQVDLNYDMIHRENLNGESKLFFDSALAKEEIFNTNVNPGEDPKFNIVKSFDYDNPNYMMVNGMKAKDGSGDPMFVYSPLLRNDVLHTSLTKLINSTAFKFGLGNQYYENKQTATTATEIIHSNSKLWRSIVKEQNGLIVPLKRIINAVLSCASYVDNGFYLGNAIDMIKVKFDDSIIIDDESVRQRALQLVELEILPKWKYLVDFENYMEAEAKALVKESDTLIQFDDDGDDEL